MYITPSAHRIFSKVGEMIEDNEKLITDEDYHFVFIRPKFFFGSSGSVWATEKVNLRYLYPNIFEMLGKKSDFSSAFRSICAQLHNSVYLYNDMCEPGDFSCAKPGAHENPCTCYEQGLVYYIQELIKPLSWEITLSSSTKGRKQFLQIECNL